MRVNLIVPFEQKDEAKKLGARWDGITKQWYVIDAEDLQPFLKWMRDGHAKPHKQPIQLGKD